MLNLTLARILSLTIFGLMIPATLYKAKNTRMQIHALCALSVLTSFALVNFLWTSHGYFKYAWVIVVFTLVANAIFLFAEHRFKTTRFAVLAFTTALMVGTSEAIYAYMHPYICTNILRTGFAVLLVLGIVLFAKKLSQKQQIAFVFVGLIGLALMAGLSLPGLSANFEQTGFFGSLFADTYANFSIKSFLPCIQSAWGLVGLSLIAISVIALFSAAIYSLKKEEGK